MAKTSTDVDGWTDEDKLPVTAETDMGELDYASLIADTGKVDISDIDDRTLVDKDELVNVPFIITDWSFNSSETGEYVRIAGITVGNKRFVFADGSTGILSQMQTADRKLGGDKRPISVPKGLRKSVYQVDLPDPTTGELRRQAAATFYLNNES